MARDERTRTLKRLTDMQERVRLATPEKKSIQFKSRLEYELLAQALYLLQQTMNLKS
jgi:hypothetical protein